MKSEYTSVYDRRQKNGHTSGKLELVRIVAIEIREQVYLVLHRHGQAWQPETTCHFVKKMSLGGG